MRVGTSSRLIVIGVWLFSVFLSLFPSSVMAMSTVDWVRVQSSEQQEAKLLSMNQAVIWGPRVAPATLHEVTFHLKNPRQQEMEALLAKISDPHSPEYGKHLTREQVQEMSRNRDGEQLIESYLQSFHIPITRRASSYITASASIAQWEEVFHTEFFSVTTADRTVTRAHHISLPKNIAEHVSMVANIVDLPVPIRKGPVRSNMIPHL